WAGLVGAGFAVFCFDHIGFGVRSEHGRRFYERYEDWSLLGKMVTDARAAIDELTKVRWIDPARVCATGYALGGKIALFTAALDDRISAVSVRCAFAPLRLCADREPSEGIRHYSHIHGLLPKLGFFESQPSRLPVDYDEIVAAIAPRPVQIVAPEMDRYNPVDRVKRSVEASRRAYALLGAESSLEIESVLDWNRWANYESQEVWLTRKAGLPPVPK
ncbi:MAG TPA: acetylxylan esterase, partial [Vicinamibacterales bacterium]|nr:acetylxylan esterase [Vicinamibacterales bacterium]